MLQVAPDAPSAAVATHASRFRLFLYIIVIQHLPLFLKLSKELGAGGLDFVCFGFTCDCFFCALLLGGNQTHNL